jgi:hypothetical protein
MQASVAKQPGHSILSMRPVATRLRESRWLLTWLPPWCGNDHDRGVGQALGVTTQAEQIHADARAINAPCGCLARCRKSPGLRRGATTQNNDDQDSRTDNSKCDESDDLRIAGYRRAAPPIRVGAA